MKSFGFLINPISGTRSKEHIPDRITSFFEGKAKVSIVKTASEEEVHKQIAAWNNTMDAIVIVGGDGSLSTALPAMLQGTAALGVIPMGSGNGLAWHVGIKPAKIYRALATIEAFETKAIDIGFVNDTPFISTAGAGIEAFAAARYKAEGQRGFMGYAKAVAKGGLFAFTPSPMRVYKEDKLIFNGDVGALTFFNASALGYNVRAIPDASLEDGALDLFLVPGFPNYKLPALFTRLALRQAHTIPGVVIERAASFRIESDTPILGQIDGDSQELPNSLSITVRKKAIKLIVPSADKRI